MSAAVGKSIVDYAGERIRGMQRHGLDLFALSAVL